MKKNSEIYKLYAVTDEAWLNGRALADDVELAIKGGATVIQLREKELSDDEFLKVALKVKVVCRSYNIPFIINDNIKVALEVDADGVHIGQSDMYSQDARELLGPNKILGVSAQTVAEAVEAYKNGADYLGVGAVFPTSTKLDAVDVPYDTLMEICDMVPIPVVAIGGINLNNIKNLKNSGIDGIAVVSAIFAQKDIELATRNLLKEVNNMLGE